MEHSLHVARRRNMYRRQFHGILKYPQQVLMPGSCTTHNVCPQTTFHCVFWNNMREIWGTLVALLLRDFCFLYFGRGLNPSAQYPLGNYMHPSALAHRAPGGTGRV